MLAVIEQRVAFSLRLNTEKSQFVRKKSLHEKRLFPTHIGLRKLITRVRLIMMAPSPPRCQIRH